MTYAMKPLPCDPAQIKGMSERLIISHYENNYGGAVKRLNLIKEKQAELDYATAPGFLINGLKREELVAMNSMILHEHFFDSLGEAGEPDAALQEALARDFGSFERWRSEFIAMGKALGGGSGWVLLSWSPRDRKLVNQWASDHCHTLAGGAPILALDMYEHSYEPPNATNPCADSPVACDDLWINRAHTGNVQIAWREINPRQGDRQGYYR